jgi:hypothetical protein
MRQVGDMPRARPLSTSSDKTPFSARIITGLACPTQVASTRAPRTDRRDVWEIVAVQPRSTKTAVMVLSGWLDLVDALLGFPGPGAVPPGTVSR